MRAIWDNTYGLLVDDGQLAIGAILALAITWVIAEYGSDGAVQENAGWVLLALVVVLIVANIYRAGHNARRKLGR
ncbi:MAG TPA: hypothetical protein VJQ09_09315 [Candidatus Limnocylindria bacterium]|nr:hypothetical protein [Candidatus Limnocylindria bacterium]